MSRRTSRRFAVVASALLLVAGRAAALEHEAVIAEGVRQTLSGELDAAEATWDRLEADHPRHPAGPVFAVYTLYARQTLDMSDPRYDEQIRRRSEEAIRVAKAHLADAPDDAEAHFYAGQAVFHLGRLQGIRGEFYSAGANGERARKHLERALELDPDFVDAKLPLGMYYYYAGLLPSMVHWLSWLWFVPKGDAPLGLRYLNEVHQDGALYRWDAAVLLMNIHTHHEPDHARAAALGAGLHRRFPDNTFVHFEWTELLLEAGDYDAVVEQSLVLEQGANGTGPAASLRRMARALRARAVLFQGRPRRAWSVMQPFGADGPARPYWGSAWVFLTRGQILDALGQRARAVEQYERVTRLRPPHGSRRARELAEQGLAEPFAPGTLQGH